MYEDAKLRKYPFLGGSQRDRVVDEMLREQLGQSEAVHPPYGGPILTKGQIIRNLPEHGSCSKVEGVITGVLGGGDGLSLGDSIGFVRCNNCRRSTMATIRNDSTLEISGVFR